MLMLMESWYESSDNLCFLVILVCMSLILMLMLMLMHWGNESSDNLCYLVILVCIFPNESVWLYLLSSKLSHLSGILSHRHPRHMCINHQFKWCWSISLFSVLYVLKWRFRLALIARPFKIVSFFLQFVKLFDLKNAGICFRGQKMKTDICENLNEHFMWHYSPLPLIKEGNFDLLQGSDRH